MFSFFNKIFVRASPISWVVLPFLLALNNAYPCIFLGDLIMSNSLFFEVL